MSINDVVTGLETRANELKKNALAELQEAQAYQRELDALDAQAAQVEKRNRRPRSCRRNTQNYVGKLNLASTQTSMITQ